MALRAKIMRTAHATMKVNTSIHIAVNYG